MEFDVDKKSTSEGNLPNKRSNKHGITEYMSAWSVRNLFWFIKTITRLIFELNDHDLCDQSGISYKE